MQQRPQTDTRESVSQRTKEEFGQKYKGNHWKIEKNYKKAEDASTVGKKMVSVQVQILAKQKHCLGAATDCCVVTYWPGLSLFVFAQLIF